MFGVGCSRVCIGSVRLFRYQHVGIGNGKSRVVGIAQRDPPMWVVLHCSGK